MAKNKNQLSQNKTEGSTDELTSRTQQKKLAHSLQDLARELSELPKSKRSKIQLPENFLTALDDLKRITSHIARKRHFQYMGKILLKTDYRSIQTEILHNEQIDAAFHVRDTITNHWLEQLILGNQDILNALYAQYEHNQVQPLRQMIRNCIKKPDNKVYRKKLFQALRSLDNEQPLPVI